MKAALNVDCRQLLVLASVVRSELGAFKREVSIFGVFLRMRRHKLARGHGHCAGDKGGEPGDQDIAAAAVRCGDAQH